MIRILDKGTILRFIIPFLSKAKRGFVCRANLTEVVLAILYKFKSGCQWSMVPVCSFLKKTKLSWKTIYHHFRKWAKDGSWKRVAKYLARQHPMIFDLSLAHFDGTHSKAVRGGPGVGYQRRRRCKTTNSLWLTDNKGLVVSYLNPMSGRHNDLFEIEKNFLLLLHDLKQKNIATNGLFINADAGFDCEALRHLAQRFGIHLNAAFNKRNRKSLDDYDWYFDQVMYQQRFKVERTNAWMDAYRSLATRFDTTLESWTAWHDLYCIVTWCRAISKV